ncbi:MAG: TRAP transporter substrate-binding protein [Pseudomonadota bacterium]
MNTKRYAVALLAAATLAAPAAAAQDVTLTLHHFLGPQSTTHARVLAPWAERIEAASDGRIAFRIFPSMTLGGRPPELYGQARDGVADIVWTLPSYTPGALPRVEVFELPGVHQGSATQTNAAMQDLEGDLSADFDGVHPLLIHTHAGNALHLRGAPVADLDDLAGLKLRTPSRTGGWMIEAWGAEAVGMPLPSLPQALSRGVVDGALIPFEVMPPFKLQELTASSIEGPRGERFGTSVFLLAMNQARYDALPADLRAIVDAESGAALAALAGAAFDDEEQVGVGRQRDSDGGRVVRLDAAAYDAMVAAASPAIDRWLAASAEAGFDGAALLAAARAAMARQSGG